MVEENNQKFEYLHLDPDESEHMAQIPEKIRATLFLANDGANLTLNIVRDAGRRCAHGTPPFFVIRSLIRVANFTRFSVIGLELGYYVGAASQMRMAYESLLYAFLFNSHPNKAQSWLRTTLDAQMNKETAISEERRLRNLAKEAFNQWTSERDLGQDIWEMASSLMHHTVESLAVEAGLEPNQLMSAEFSKALQTTEGDFDSAIKLTSLLSRFGNARNEKRSETKEEARLPWTGEFGGLFDEEWLDLWSTILLYLVHRMTDFAYTTFLPTNRVTIESYEGWHQAVKTSN